MSLCIALCKWTYEDSPWIEANPIWDWRFESLRVEDEVKEEVEDEVEDEVEEDVCKVLIVFCQMSSDIPSIEAVTYRGRWLYQYKKTTFDFNFD